MKGLARFSVMWTLANSVALTVPRKEEVNNKAGQAEDSRQSRKKGHDSHVARLNLKS
jgi:hypothetical protein